MAAERQGVPLVTPTLFLEYEDVLNRVEQRAVSGLDLTQVDATLIALPAAIEPVEVRFAWRSHLYDLDDGMVLAGAVDACADALVTHNIVDFTATALTVELLVLSPGALLERML